MAKYLYRGGRRIPIPSTVEIKHAYMAFSVVEAHRGRWAAEEGMPSNASWDEIIERRSRRLASEQAGQGCDGHLRTPS